MLSFILSSAAKHDVDSESLSSELQQLGLPKGKDICFINFFEVILKTQHIYMSIIEHTTGLCKSYEEKHIALQEKLRESSLRCEYYQKIEEK